MSFRFFNRTKPSPLKSEWLKVVRGSLEENENESVDVLFSEPVGYDPATGEGISARHFNWMLNSAPKGKCINLLINSPGGLVDEGVAIHNMIRQRGNVNTVVIGSAASMGAVIFQAGVKRHMMPGTMMMIHNPWGSFSGDYRDMEKMGDTLKKIKESLVSLFVGRTGMSPEKVSEMMDVETTMDADEAIKLGFADEVADEQLAWNSIPRPSAFQVARVFGFRRANSLQKGAPPSPAENNTMKHLLTALAKVKLLPSDTLDEGAAVSAFEKSFGELQNSAEENKSLKAQIEKLTNEAKSRVENKVKEAVKNGLIKESRSQSYIDAGLANEPALDAQLADLAEAKGQAAPAPRNRAAAPVPAASGQAADTSAEMDSLREQLKTADPAEAVVISRKLRALRGHKDIFNIPANKN